MSKKNKSLSLLMATTTVASLGVGSAVTSFGAYTESEANAQIQSLTNLANVVSDFISKVGIDYETLLGWINEDGSVNIPDDRKSIAKSWLDSMQNAGKLTYDRGLDGTYSFKVGETAYEAAKVKELLKAGKDYIAPIVNNNTGSSSFVTSTGSTSTGSTSTGSTSTGSTSTGSTSTGSTSTGSTSTKSDVVVETTSKVTTAYKLDEIKANTEVKLGQMVESLKTTTSQETAVTLNVGNAKWIIEKKDLDMTKAADFSFNPAVATTEVSHTTAVIPEEVKRVANGKANVVLNFTEKQVKDTKGQIVNQQLPFKAKVAVSVGTQYANKKMKVYYIVNGKSYDAGSVVVDKNGRVLCIFGLIGDFVLVEEGAAAPAVK